MPSLTISTIDRQSKPTSMSMDVVSGATGAQEQAVNDAIDAVILGSAAKCVETTATVVDAGSQTPPNDVNANRGNKWLLRMQDSTSGTIYNHEIGTADSAQLPSATVDYLDLTAGVGLALKTAVDAVYQSPLGNAGVLLSVQQVNRKD